MKKKIIRREDGKDYLIRYTLFTCRWFSVKIHNILSSDYDCMHDHLWAFITFILKGGYVEYMRPAGVADKIISRGGAFDRSKVYGRFSLLYRPANYVHRLEIHQPVWTFVITFKKTRQWGFYTKLKGWVHWRDYTPTNGCE